MLQFINLDSDRKEDLANQLKSVRFHAHNCAANNYHATREVLKAAGIWMYSAGNHHIDMVDEIIEDWATVEEPSEVEKEQEALFVEIRAKLAKIKAENGGKLPKEYRKTAQKVGF